MSCHSCSPGNRKTMLRKTQTLFYKFHRRHPAVKPLPAVACLTIAVFLSFFGCAKIGDPQPPEIRVPKAAVDLTALQRMDHVELRVSAPRQNTNGTAVTTLQRVDVYRLAENASGIKQTNPLPADRFMREADLILSIPEARLSDYRLQNFLVIEDGFSNLEQTLTDTHAFRYAVIFVNDKNQAAGFSNQAVIVPVAIPLPPAGMTAEVTEASINLKWEAPSENMDGSKPARISGYNIYRSTDPESPPSPPVNPDPLQKPEFKDIQFNFDTTYYYRVSVVTGSGNASAESLRSKDLEVTPRDIFPPLPAGDFTAVFGNDIVILLWKQSPSPDVAGYRISRQEEGTAKGQPLEETLITDLSYRDISIRTGRKYAYTLIAVDAYGNESSAVGTETTTQ
jgi:hypothetical protein